ncbi:MAG TPA: DMT family transporter [Bacillota bacterium]|jgi:drug/metabolite transporter (DMT)-like permease|nr:DMT family transporter [Bacillota bacterium]HQC81893.1 DMT family transporter [Bacillota bacterium]
MEKKIEPEKASKNRQSKNMKLVYTAAGLFSFIVGFSFLAIKISMSMSTPLEILTYRYNFAAVAALVPLIIWRSKIDLSNKPKKRLILTAAFYLGFMAFQAYGLIYATSIESGIIFAVVPIFAKIIAYFYLGEKGTWKQNFFIIMSISAVVAMFVFSVQDFQGVNAVGLILLFISSVLMALSNVLMRGVRSEYNPYTIAFCIALSGCLLFNIMTLIEGAASGEPLQYFAPLFHWEFVLATAFLGVLSTMVSSLLAAYMLANMEAVKATIFGNLSTAISIIAGVVFLREPLYIYQIICTVLIVIGVVGTTLSGMAKEEIEEE